MEMMQTVRGFINLIKANPTTRDHYKINKLANLNYGNLYTPYKQNIKFYIAEPKMPLDNQLQLKVKRKR